MTSQVAIMEPWQRLVVGVLWIITLDSLVPASFGQYVEEDPFVLFESGKYIELSSDQMEETKIEQK